MSDLILLSHTQMRRIEPFFPRSRGLARVDDPAGDQRDHLCHPARPAVEGCTSRLRSTHKTLYNRFIRWSRLGVFARIFAALAAEGGLPERLMIDSTHLKAHRTAASLLQKGVLFAVSAAPRAV